MMNPDDIKAEQLDFAADKKILYDIAQEAREHALSLQDMSDEALFERVEAILVERIKTGDKKAHFQIGLLHYVQQNYEKARKYFERSANFDYQSKYQLSVMLYDGLGGNQDCSAGVELMLLLSQSTSRHARHLLSAVRFNIGRAYFQGYGVKHQSDQEAEKWWLLAADDGNPNASVKAQTMLGMFYAREGNLVLLDKSFFWHTEACGNGSVESQGALGAMYLYGLGVRKNIDAAHVCLKDASDRGNVYAMGTLVNLYFLRKFYTKAADLANKVALFNDIKLIAEETNCLEGYIRKGISLACFLLARCLANGLGVQKDLPRAKRMYSRSFQFDPNMCAREQNEVINGYI